MDKPVNDMDKSVKFPSEKGSPGFPPVFDDTIHEEEALFFLQ